MARQKENATRKRRQSKVPHQSLPGQFFQKLKKIERSLEEFYMAPYRRERMREIRREEDLFLLLLFSDMLGAPNPVIWYAAELIPYVFDSLHDWHTRMGMEHSPFDGLQCC